MRSIQFSLTLCIVFSVVTLTLPQLTYAQAEKDNAAGTLGVARVVQVKDKGLKDGTILSTSVNGFASPSSIPYDSQVQGVISRDAGIIMNNGAYDGVPVISVGTVYVLVSSLNGPIQKGDLIATSSIPGVGVKAIKDGYVIGSALENYQSNDPKKSDLIAIEFNLHYFNAKPQFPGALTDILKIAFLPTKDGPAPIFKYIIAAIVCITSFVLAFLTFGRTAAQGIEALGRNPAAGKIIHLGIMFNVAIVVVIVVAGLIISFFILRL